MAFIFNGKQTTIMTDENKSMSKAIGAAIIFFAIGSFGSFKSIENDFIGSKTFASIFIVLILASLLIAFWPKVQEFKISALGLEVKLREIKKAESDIKELVKAIYEAVDSDSSSVKWEGWDEDRYKRAMENLRKLTE